MRSGLQPSDIRGLDDLRKLPLLSKDDVRENLHFDLLSDNHEKRKILKIKTSGSTGEPFVCYADQHQLEIRWAATQRSMEWTGYRFGDRCARLWHQTLGMSWAQRLRERIDAWFNRRLFIPAFEMSDDNIARFVAKLRAYRPVLLDGYAESFNFLAHYIKSHGLESFHPKAVISSAQVLPEQSREIIEKALGCGVFDKYGSREFSGIAYECEQHDGHHVVAESYIVEILKDGAAREAGRVGRGRHHRSQQLLRALDPLSRRRPRRGHGRRASPAAAGADCRGSGASRGASRRSSWAATAATSPARSSPTCSRTTTTSSASIR